MSIKTEVAKAQKRYDRLVRQCAQAQSYVDTYTHKISRLQAQMLDVACVIVTAEAGWVRGTCPTCKRKKTPLNIEGAGAGLCENCTFMLSHHPQLSPEIMRRLG